MYAYWNLVYETSKSIFLFFILHKCGLGNSNFGDNIFFFIKYIRQKNMHKFYINSTILICLFCICMYTLYTFILFYYFNEKYKFLRMRKSTYYRIGMR